MGQISKDKVRTGILIEKDLKYWLEEKAKEDDRSFNSFVVKILKEYQSKNFNNESH